MVQQNRQQIMAKSFKNSFIDSTNARSQAQRKQQINQRSQKPQSRKQSRAQDLTEFNNTVRELCAMYDAVTYFGKAEYEKKNSWRIINKQQLNAATIYAIRYAPVVPKRQQSRPQSRKQSAQPQPKQQSRPQSRKQSSQPQQSRKQSRGGRRIGGCQYKPNVPRVYSYNTTPLPASLYPEPKDFNHLFDAFTYFGNQSVKNVKSWIESTRTRRLSSVASVFAKRNAPVIPRRQSSGGKKSQPQKRQQQAQQQPRNIPKQQSNKKQKGGKKQMINQQPLSNVWEEYYVSPRHSMFK